MTHDASVVIFITQLAVLLVAGRIAGELAQRVGQPAVLGQIIAGLLLGPSVLGALAPGLWHGLFPQTGNPHVMLDAVAQLGVILLLLMTGMDTDLSVFRDARRAALSISLSGIIVPFACGIALGALLPESLLPTPPRRAITALFLGTALSISSVKIVALVVRDLGFLRRTVGQVIIASSILDDTIGWVIVAVTFGLALHGSVDFAALTRMLLGTACFLALSFTLGRRWVYRLLRWSNDNLKSELALVTVVVVIAAVLALATAAIGVHLLLGAFVAGILIGQSPLLTRRIQAPLRGLIIALFMPVFFALAGLTADLRSLAGQGLYLTGGLILVASFGKFSGAFLGGRIGGLTYAESFAVGCGMNARGSTEIIVASIGLSMGALDQRFFTAIVAMAVVTTFAMGVASVAADRGGALAHRARGIRVAGFPWQARASVARGGREPERTVRLAARRTARGRAPHPDDGAASRPRPCRPVGCFRAPCEAFHRDGEGGSRCRRRGGGGRGRQSRHYDTLALTR
jgi:Kef-type K+ transport system membrane component KefB